MMKKRIAVLLTGLLMLFAMAACGSKDKKPHLRGTYKEVSAISTGSITFKSDTEMEFTFLDISKLTVSGTHELTDGKLYMHYSILGIPSNPSYTFSQKGNSIYLDGTEYRKE